MLIVAILTAVGVPKFVESLSRFRAEAAARRVKTDLGLARQHAISTSTPQTVTFVPGTESYSVTGLTDPDHPSQPYVIDLTESPYHSLLVSAALGGDAVVVFDRYGVPDTGGTITVESGGYQRLVDLDPDTGKATMP